MNLTLLLTLTYLYCVPIHTSSIMVGQVKGKDSPTVPPQNPTISLEQLQTKILQLGTPELQLVIERLLDENRKRIGFSDPAIHSPLSQGHNPLLGGQVGAAGGWRVSEPDYCVGNQERGNLDPPPSLGQMHIPPNTCNSNHFYNQDTLRGNVGVVSPCVDYSTLQASLQAMSEGLLKAALKEGVLRQDTPTLPAFTGKASDGNPAWRRWELQIKGLVGIYSDRAIKDAMNRALQGDAAIVADSLDDNCTWQELLEALKSKFANVSSWCGMMRNFYAISQGSGSVSQFAIQLEKVLGDIRVSHPKALKGGKFTIHLRNRFFYGLTETLRNNLRHKFDQGCSYQELLVCARKVESEIEETLDKVCDSSSKTNIEPAAIQNERTTAELKKLEWAYKCSQGEFTKMQQHIKELQDKNTFAKTSQVSGQQPSQIQQKHSKNNQQQPKAQPSYHLGQSGKGYDNLNYSSNQGSRERHGRRGNKQMSNPPGKPKGWSRLCYWCRNFVPFEKANHRVRDCPFYQQGKQEWWNLQQRYSSTPTEPDQTLPETEDSLPQENWIGILLGMGMGFLKLNHPTI